MRFMRKIISFLSIGIIVLCLCSCTKAVEDITYDTTISVTETTMATTVSSTEPITEKTTRQKITTTAKQTTTAVTTKKVTETQKPATTQSTTEKKETTVENSCASGNHSMGVGNIGRWFNSRSEVQAYVGSVMDNWSNKFHNGEITREEYYKNCPQGYKAWSCSSCGKWTGNFTY